MITFNGFKFAKNEKDFSASLFDYNGGTCFGFYKARKNGIVLMDHQKTVIALIAFDGSISFLVTAWKNEKGQILCMNSATDETEKMLNLQGKGYTEKLDLCSDTRKQLEKNIVDFKK